MSGETEATADDEDFGLPLEQFEAAVNALVELRDSGKLLIFLTRRGTVKLIGEIEDFRKEFGDQANEPSITLTEAKNAQDEIQRLIFLILRMRTPEVILSFLERHYAFGSGTDVKSEPRQDFRRKVEPKIATVTGKLVSEAMRERVNRLTTTVGVCIEDIDYEIITEREDNYSRRIIKEPFMRLRLRYTQSTQGDHSSYGFILSPYVMPVESVAPGFEFECDASDIDLLLKRLSDAKQRLLRLQEPESEAL